MNLTKEDLVAVKATVHDTINESVPKIVHEVLEPAFDELRQEIAAAFAEVHARFDALEIRLDKLEARVDRIEGKLDIALLRLNDHDRQFIGVWQKLGS